MKTITLLAVMAMLLMDFLGSKSSVGGPLTDLLVLFIVMLVVGIYDAWSNSRGPFGWIVSIVMAAIGGLVANMLEGMAMETVLTAVHFQGKLAASQWSYIISAGTAALTVFGSWIAIQVVHGGLAGMISIFANKGNAASGR